MKLIIRNISSRFSNHYILFEHADVFSAKYEIITRVESHIAEYPKVLSLELVSESQNGYFMVRGVELSYSNFIGYDIAYGKNKYIPTGPDRFLLTITEPDILSLDEWFNMHKLGQVWENTIHSTIKNSHNKDIDSYLMKL